jgi:hypothetical protein
LRETKVETPSGIGQGEWREGGLSRRLRDGLTKNVKEPQAIFRITSRVNFYPVIGLNIGSKNITGDGRVISIWPNG